MSNRDNRVVTYLTDAEKAQLDEWAETTDKSMAHLLREAVLEYTDRDRTARIEEKVDKALTLLEDGEHTHTRTSESSASGNTQKSVPEKAREIARRVYQNHESPVKGTDVEIAIEDIAGGDERTLAKYTDQLKKRDLMFEHPVQPIWTDSKREWVQWVENATVDKSVHDWTDEYRMSFEEYDDIAEEINQ